MTQAVWRVQGQGPWALMSYWWGWGGGECKIDRDSRKGMQQRPFLEVEKQELGAELSSMEGILWRECEGCTGVTTPR